MDKENEKQTLELQQRPADFSMPPVLGIAHSYPEQEIAKRGTIDNFFNYATGALTSAATGYYNTYVSLNNFLGGSAEEASVYDNLKAMGADESATYYLHNKDAVDGGGLFLGSIVPGLAGIKAFHALANVAPTGRLRSVLNLSEGLTAARAEAKTAMLAADGMHSALTQQAMKAYAKGFGANVLDAFAFELGATAFSFNAPAYSEATSGDIATNMFWNTMFGGALGGVFSATKTYWGLASARREADKLTFSDRYVPVQTGQADVTISSLVLSKKTGTDTVAAKANQEISNLIHGEVVKIAEGGKPSKLSLGMAGMLNKLEPENHLATVAGMRKVTSVAALREEEAMIAAQKQRLADAEANLAAVASAGADEKLLAAAQKAVDKASAAVISPAPTRVVNLLTGRSHSSPEALPTHLGDMLKAGEKLTPVAGKAAVQIGERATIQAALDAVPEIATEQIQAARYLLATGKLKARTELSSKNLPEIEYWAERADKLPKNGIMIDGVAFTSPTPLVMKMAEVKADLIRNSLKLPLEEQMARYNVGQKFFASGMEETMAVPLSKQAEHLENPLHAIVRYDERIGAIGQLNIHEAETYIANVTAAIEEERKLLGAAFSRQYDLKGGATLPDDSLAQKMLVASAAAGVESTASMFGAASSAQGSFGALTQKIGLWTTEAIAAVQARTANELNPHIAKLRADKAVGREYILLKNKLALSEANYAVITDDLAQRAAAVGYNIEATTGLIRTDLAAWIVKASNAKAAGKKRLPARNLQDLQGELIHPTSPDLHAFMMEQAGVNTIRRSHSKGFNSSAGFADVMEGEELGLLRYYNIPVDTRKYPFFALVAQSDGIGATSHKSLITAKDEASLLAKIKRLESDPATQGKFQFFADDKLAKKYQVYFKHDVEGYYKALGEYQYARGMNENIVDSTLRRKGLLGDEAPSLSDADVIDAIDDIVNWNYRMDARLVRDFVEHRFSNTIQQLQFLGTLYDKAGQSFLGTASNFIFSTKANPYADTVKQMLALSQKERYPNWLAANEWVERNGSKYFGTASNLMKSVVAGEKDYSKAALELQDHLNRNGIGATFTEAMVKGHAEEIAQKPIVGEFVHRGQFYLSSMTLGLDPLNAITNAISQVVLMGELSSLTKAIKLKNPEVAGKLVEVSTGTIGGMMAPAKLMASSLARFWTGGQVWNPVSKAWEHRSGQQLLQEYRDHTIIADDLYQHRLLAEEFMNPANATPGKIRELTDKGLEAGRKWTGNNLAERFTRFMAADTARQLTDHAMAAGIIKDTAEAAVYWNTTANRAQGVIVSSQRPSAFQGPIGQAIGLFMSYQFNLLQQAARYAGTGDKGALMMAAGMQVTLFGLQGLPAFNAINTHLIGNKGGNIDHEDLYSGIPQTIGKEAGDWMLYGAASNALGLFHPDLKLNLYTRGDINPRQVTVLPLNPFDLPLVKATSNAVGQTLGLFQNVLGGADISESFLHALAHNGINRPLAGLANVMQGGETTGQGTLLAGTDGSFFANMVRIAGGKPLDSALANDALYRFQAYAAHDSRKRKELAERFKLDVRAGDLDNATLNEYMMSYAAAGGKIDGFNAWAVNQYKNATIAQVNQFAMNQNETLAKNMRVIMGGQAVNNFED